MRLPNKSVEVFQRGPGGKLLPSKINIVKPPVEGDWEVWMKPMTIGEINQMKSMEAFATSNHIHENTLVSSHFVFDGKYLSEEEVRYLRTDWVAALMGTLMYHSGFNLNSLGYEESIPANFKREQTRFQKEVTQKIKKKSKHTKMINFLHEKGIPYFDIPKLCYPEVDHLVEGHNEYNKT